MTRRFYTAEMQAWLGGYEPVLAQELSADRRAQGNRVGAAKQTARRMEAAAQGIDYGNGTILGLSRRVTANDPGKAGRIKKPSTL